MVLIKVVDGTFKSYNFVQITTNLKNMQKIDRLSFIRTMKVELRAHNKTGKTEYLKKKKNA